jgi:hypothetical protein
MANPYPEKVVDLMQALLTSPAESTASRREAVFNYANHLAQRMEVLDSIPDNLTEYVNKIILQSYRITDDDIKQLKIDGYSEDQIFELTLCAAVGASFARMQCGLNALQGES